MIFEGIVEDNNDPEKLGRCKTRVFGLHTENKSQTDNFQQLSTDDLPWAMPAFNIDGSIDEIGDFKIPRNGSLLYLFSLDPPHHQRLVYFASGVRIFDNQKDIDSSKGFADPGNKHPDSKYLKESPISRLARNEKIDQTIVEIKRNSKISGIQCNNNSFDEPDPFYNATYPHNKVFQTEAGHIIEVDDTSGSERIHLYHKSGTFIEIGPNGEVVYKNKNKNYKIIESDNNELVKGEVNRRFEKSVNTEILKEYLLKIVKKYFIESTSEDIHFKCGKGKIVISGDDLEVISKAVIGTTTFQNFIDDVINHQHPIAQALAIKSETLAQYAILHKIPGKFYSESVKHSEI